MKCTSLLACETLIATLSAENKTIYNHYECGHLNRLPDEI